jgi:hypothetical protein
MDELIEKIHIQYLQGEILKMKNTVVGLEEMIDEKDSIKDNDLIEMLKKIRSTTLDNIEKKKRELKNLYPEKVEIDNN